ncbi:MAG: hypothetical protein U1E65_15295 [Myxococcota bacterium]
MSRLPRRILPVALLSACGSAVAPPVHPAGPTSMAALDSVAGTGAGAFDGDGKPATSSALYGPVDLSFDAQGRALIIDFNNHRVRRLELDGTLRTVVGTGVEAYGTVNQDASAFPVHHPMEIEVRAGEWFLAGYHDPRVFRVDSAEKVRVVAGIGAQGNDGDEGDAQLARLDAPSGVAVGDDGAIFVADELTHRVRRVDAQGIIHAFAGTGHRGYSGDGGPAAQAQLNGPLRLRYDHAAHALYIADAQNHAIRRVDAAGIISTVVGTGSPGFSGDGGPADQATLNRPMDLELLDDGGFVIADSENFRIRRVYGDGTIGTLVGSSTTSDPSIEHTTVVQAALHTPWGVSVDSEGHLWIADTFHNRVRRAAPELLDGTKRRDP